jgi:hypothetical protein
VGHFSDHLVERSGRVSIFVDVRRVEKVLSRTLEVVLGAERIEKTGRGTEVGDCRSVSDVLTRSRKGVWAYCQPRRKYQRRRRRRSFGACAGRSRRGRVGSFRRDQGLWSSRGTRWCVKAFRSFGVAWLAVGCRKRPFGRRVRERQIATSAWSGAERDRDSSAIQEGEWATWASSITSCRPSRSRP